MPGHKKVLALLARSSDTLLVQRFSHICNNQYICILSISGASIKMEYLKGVTDKMYAELLVAIAVFLLAVLIIGTAFLLQRRIEKRSGDSTSKTCQDICTDESGRVSDDCAVLCAYGWP